MPVLPQSEPEVIQIGLQQIQLNFVKVQQPAPLVNKADKIHKADTIHNSARTITDQQQAAGIRVSRICTATSFDSMEFYD